MYQVHSNLNQGSGSLLSLYGLCGEKVLNKNRLSAGCFLAGRVGFEYHPSMGPSADKTKTAFRRIVFWRGGWDSNITPRWGPRLT
jgi:hypothetical protein